MTNRIIDNLIDILWAAILVLVLCTMAAGCGGLPEPLPGTCTVEGQCTPAFAAAAPPFPAAPKIFAALDVPRNAVAMGAAVWGDVGVHFEITTDWQNADVSIISDGKPDCPDSDPWRGSEGWVPGALPEGVSGKGWSGPHIEVHITCYPRAGAAGDPDESLEAEVIAHELGHFLGLAHIPQQIPALMNPAMSEDHPFLQDADKLAFWDIWQSFGS